MLASLLAALVVLTPGTYDDAHPGLYYSGHWSFTDQDEALRTVDGTLAIGEDATAAVEMSFVGSSVAIIVVLGPAYGTAQVCVNEECVTADWNAAASVRAELLTISDLPSGVNTLTIQANGDGVITLDAAIIGAELQPEVTAEPRGDQVVTFGDGGQGRLIYDIDAGQVALFMVLSIIAIFTGALFVIAMMERNK